MMLKETLALASLTLSLTANAAILDLGTITRDTNTGLDWLDVTETRHLNYNQVKSELSSGGDYDGWRFATAIEFDELVSNFGYTPVNSSCSNGVVHCDLRIRGDNLIVEYMIRTLGDTLDPWLDDTANIQSQDVSPTGAGEVRGYLAEYVPNPSITTFVSIATITDYETVYRDTGEYFHDIGDSVFTLADYKSREGVTPTIGSFLVRTSEVPLPAASWLFGGALIGLAGIKRKK